MKLLSYLLEGTAGSHVESIGDEEKGVIEGSHDSISTGSILLNLLSFIFCVNYFFTSMFICYILIMCNSLVIEAF